MEDKTYGLIFPKGKSKGVNAQDLVETKEETKEEKPKQEAPTKKK